MAAGTEPIDPVVVMAVGDLTPSRPDPDSLFVHTADALRGADITFGQLEINLTERGTRLPQARHTDRTPPATAHAFARAGFDVVSFAGNHCMDWGPDGFFDTIAALESAGLAVVGVGADIAAARRAVVIERSGVRVAFLAYSSILPMNYWAEVNRPGCAPMRAFTHYEQIEHDQPGTPARIRTFAHDGDLAALEADVAAARAQADVVLVSLHWGIHFIPAVIADYQRQVGRAAIDAGADAVLGHHAHILKGVEVHRGRPIIHSLCNFAVDLHMDPAHAASPGFREIQGLHPEWVPNFDSSYNFPADSRRTVVAKLELGAEGLRRVALLPTYVGLDSVPQILVADDPRFDEVHEYLVEMTAQAELNGRFTVDGDELVIDGVGAAR